MLKKSLILLALLFFLATPQACSAESSTTDSGIPDEEALLFINDSEFVIKGIYILRIGTENWSENLLGDKPLKKREKRKLDISRSSLFGFYDMKIVYGSGIETIWKKLPITEIFSITHNSGGTPEYEQICLST
ncbi:MAG: hypothetical protein LLF78_06490 [Synergistaceae bacterium]|nr:hypothetical protein [Synergistaceae bacterium]